MHEKKGPLYNLYIQKIKLYAGLFDNFGIQSKTDLECVIYRGADKSLARPGRKQATVTEDFDVHISYLSS